MKVVLTSGTFFLVVSCYAYVMADYCDVDGWMGDKLQRVMADVAGMEVVGEQEWERTRSERRHPLPFFLYMQPCLCLALSLYSPNTLGVKQQYLGPIIRFPLHPPFPPDSCANTRTISGQLPSL